MIPLSRPHASGSSIVSNEETTYAILLSAKSRVRSPWSITVKMFQRTKTGFSFAPLDFRLITMLRCNAMDWLLFSVSKMANSGRWLCWQPARPRPTFLTYSMIVFYICIFTLSRFNYRGGGAGVTGLECWSELKVCMDSVVWFLFPGPLNFNFFALVWICCG